MRTTAKRILVATLAAAIALPVMNPANAASPTPIGKVAKPADDVEFSSDHRRYYRHHRGDAAALAAMAAIFGTVAALAATSRHRDRYDHHPYGYYGSYHYGPHPYGYYPRDYDYYR